MASVHAAVAPGDHGSKFEYGGAPNGRVRCSPAARLPGHSRSWPVVHSNGTTNHTTKDSEAHNRPTLVRRNAHCGDALKPDPRKACTSALCNAALAYTPLRRTCMWMAPGAGRSRQRETRLKLPCLHHWLWKIRRPARNRRHRAPLPLDDSQHRKNSRDSGARLPCATPARDSAHNPETPTPPFERGRHARAAPRCGGDHSSEDCSWTPAAAWGGDAPSRSCTHTHTHCKAGGLLKRSMFTRPAASNPERMGVLRLHPIGTSVYAIFDPPTKANPMPQAIRTVGP